MGSGESADLRARKLCIYSQRAIRRDVSRCSGYEFEDVVAQVEDSDLIVGHRPEAREIMYRMRRRLSKSTPMFRHMPSGTVRTPLRRDHDLFGCFMQKPLELLSLDALPNWRQRSRMAFAVLEELWHTTIEDFEPLVKSLDRFDLIACAFESTCERLEELTGRPVVHLPGAADLLAFAPSDIDAPRPIDVYYMGRRRPELHKALKSALDARGGFYLYDSAELPPIAQDHVTHRELLANLVRRSKIFIVDYGKIGHADQRAGQIIWGPRHVEGMAGGAIQAGYAPDTPDYHAHFDWPEAVERLAEDPGEAVEQILALLDNPGEMRRRRQVNLAEAAGRHDWLHRWDLITGHFGLAETPGSARRRAALHDLEARYREARARRSG